jgi:hypothetical protein
VSPDIADPVQAERFDGTHCGSGSTVRSATTHSAPTRGRCCWRRSTLRCSTTPSPRWSSPETAHPSAAEAISPSSAPGRPRHRPSGAHPASPALALDELARRLGRRCRAEIHGRVLGSGLEMAAFCGWVRCRPDAVLGLPEPRWA